MDTLALAQMNIAVAQTAIFGVQAIILAVQIWYLGRTFSHERRSRAQELRAYVFVDLAQFEMKKPRPSQIVSNPLKRTTGRITYRFRNTGKTPAGNVRVGARAVMIAPEEILDLNDVGKLRPMGPMGPKDSLDDEIEIEGLLHGQDVKAHVDDGRRVHVFGRIEYRDEFGKPCWTTFHSYVGGDVAWERNLHTAVDGNDFR